MWTCRLPYVLDVVSRAGSAARLACAFVTSLNLDLLPSGAFAGSSIARGFLRSRVRTLSTAESVSNSRPRSLSLSLFSRRFVTACKIASTSSSSGSSATSSSSKASCGGDSGTGLCGWSRPSVVTAVIDTLVSKPLCLRVGLRLPLLPNCSSNSMCTVSTVGGEAAFSEGMGSRLELELDVLGFDLRFRGKGGLESISASGSGSSGEETLPSSSSTILGNVGALASRLGGGETLGSGIGRRARGSGGLVSGVEDRECETPHDLRMRPSCFMRVCVCSTSDVRPPCEGTQTHRSFRIRQDLARLLLLLLQLRAEGDLGCPQTEVLDIECRYLSIEFFDPCAQRRVQPGTSTG